MTTLVTLFLANRYVSPVAPALLSTLTASPPLLFLPWHDTWSHSRTIFVEQPRGLERATVISRGTAFHSARLGTTDRVAGMSIGRPSGPKSPCAAAGSGLAAGLVASGLWSFAGTSPSPDEEEPPGILQQPVTANESTRSHAARRVIVRRYYAPRARR